MFALLYCGTDNANSGGYFTLEYTSTDVEGVGLFFSWEPHSSENNVQQSEMDETLVVDLEMNMGGPLVIF